MKTDTPRPVRLSDYRPPAYLADTVALDIRLAPEKTTVKTRLALRANPHAPERGAALVLDGEGLELHGLSIDGAVVAPGAMDIAETHLTIQNVPGRPFVVEYETECNPAANTALSGLYRTSDTYCTQCEAEGFRRITYFPDRPDVLAKFTVRLEARRSEAPVLLSNGNLIEAGDIPGTDRHFAIWHDPHPKPSYLFALVGGDLACVEDRFTTMSGREVVLRIYVEHGKQDRCAYAMDALKRAMRWDEETYGREYDLDIFMIVAVSDFNMGAMENKGLNVFNDKYILARPDTASDMDYANIEGIIAHEYFHNWTGNRITCRDWFQLCLKEGLTVFRDQEYSADMRSRAVKRIGDVKMLRAHQFPEDAGPLAHPVRPSSYIEINNFYTATVYEKGAELVRMLKLLIGDAAFFTGMDLYFERHDGEAATVEQFIAAMADASARDLDPFMQWYAQAGTPEIVVSEKYSPAKKTYRLHLVQTCAPTPGQANKKPLPIPLTLGLMNAAGDDLPLTLEGQGPMDRPVIELSEAEQTLTFTGIEEKPVLSLNRNFSAPVTIRANRAEKTLLFAMAHDSDPFNRWEAGQIHATKLLVSMVEAVRAKKPPRRGADLARALGASLKSDQLEPAFIALMLQLPGEADLAREIASDVDPGAIHTAREALRATIGQQLRGDLEAVYGKLQVPGPYNPDARSAGKRALRATVLSYLAAADPKDGARRALAQYETAQNMTDAMAALLVLSRLDCPQRPKALSAFYERWRDDHLVIDKWLSLQAAAPFAYTPDTVRRLMDHESFALANPNKVRALIGVFATANPVAFNAPGGEGYTLVADVILKLDPMNPQVAARLAGAFRNWRILEPRRRARARTALKKIAAQKWLSRDTFEIVTKTLG